MIINRGTKQIVPVPRMGSVPRDEQPSKRTSAGLRNALFDEIDALRRGDGDPQKAHAVAKLAMTILYTAKLELQFKLGLQDSEKTLPAIPLGDSEDIGDG